MWSSIARGHSCRESWRSGFVFTTADRPSSAPLLRPVSLVRRSGASPRELARLDRPLPPVPGWSANGREADEPDATLMELPCDKSWRPTSSKQSTPQDKHLALQTKKVMNQRLFAVVNANAASAEAEVTLSLTGFGPIRHAMSRANPRKPIRFAVGRPGRRSALWRMWANRHKNDVYVAARQSAGLFKVSLHESGDWRIQWVGPDHGDVEFHSNETDPDHGRVMHRWRRPEPRKSGWTEALSIWVPCADVSDIPGDLEPGHDAQWLESPPPGCATEFRIMMVKPGHGPYELTKALLGKGSGIALINGFQLADGEVVLLFAATVALDKRLVAQLESTRREARSSITSDFDLSPESGPRAAVIFVDDDGHRNIWDLTLSSSGRE